MSRAREPSWAELFTGDETAGSPVLLHLRLLRRAGEPLLLVPTNPKFAAVALSLYPAQRTKARLIREGLRQLWRLGIPVNFETVAISLIPDAPFPKFLAQGAATTPGAFPPLAILCGNPEASGRRFVILVFGPDRTPAAVVKAGIGEAAGRLIDREATFLKSVPRGAPAIPELRGTFYGQNVHALALNFVGGNTPLPKDYDGVGKLLTSWLDRGELRRLGDLPAWRALEGACRSHPLWEGVAGSLRNRLVRPTIFHGDFAPWNIKVSPQDRSWAVLDWERGELVGIPGWDWFHYVFQHAILVSRLPLAGAVQRIHKLLHHAAFERYTSAAAIDGVQRELFLTYLICYSRSFGSPKSGADFEGLLKRLAGS
jgi:hypothetical protein